MPINLADALVGPDVLRPYLNNWSDVVSYFIRTVEADALADGSEATKNLLKRLQAYPDVAIATESHPLTSGDTPILPMHFRKDDIDLKLFTTISILGTPQDVTVQELRVECFFPLNDETAEVFRGWATTDRADL